jgi:hypothetical protein
MCQKNVKTGLWVTGELQQTLYWLALARIKWKSVDLNHLIVTVSINLQNRAFIVGNFTWYISR